MILIQFITKTKRQLANNSIIISCLSLSSKAQLKIYDLKTPLFQKILTNELLFLPNLFKKYNFELKIAGGAVRDLLMGKLPNDIDLATDALPNQMINIFEKEGVRVLNLKGLKHGTVPVRINDKVNLF
jgi:tRNA nucleotidyltransferase (CCA-adding enzyme)